MKQKKILLLVILIAVSIVMLSGCSSFTDDQSGASATGEQQAVDQDADPFSQLLGSRSQGMQIVGLLTVLALAPSILINGNRVYADHYRFIFDPKCDGPSTDAAQPGDCSACAVSDVFCDDAGDRPD